MLFLLLLFIVPSAIGLYFLLKPPVHIDYEADSKAVTSIATPFISLEEIPITVTPSTALLRKQTVNE